LPTSRILSCCQRERFRLAMDVGRALRVTGSARQRTHEHNDLEHPRRAHERIDDPREGSLLPPEKSRHEIKLEEADEPPIHGADDDKDKRNDIESFHWFLLVTDGIAPPPSRNEDTTISA